LVSPKRFVVLDPFLQFSFRSKPLASRSKPTSVRRRRPSVRPS
jgi:hypothetical protein